MFDFMTLFISPAFAADVAAPVADVAEQSGSVLMRFMPLFLIFLVFYFLLIRPQQKQADAHQNMIKKLKKGDRIITKAGFTGTITKVDDEHYVHVEISKGVIVQVVRETIVGPVDENKPANENKDKKD